MNRKQVICLWIGIIVIVALGIYPHWMIPIESTVRGESAFFGIGRHFLLHQYNKQCQHEYNTQCQMDTSRLSVQWIIVAVITGGLVVTFADKKDKKPTAVATGKLKKKANNEKLIANQVEEL